ncbi:MAG: SGNH/GDSL hydrolase family protein [Polyangiales bacterium]
MSRLIGLALVCSLAALGCGDDAGAIAPEDEDPRASETDDEEDDDSSMRDAGSRIDGGIAVVTTRPDAGKPDAASPATPAAPDTPKLLPRCVKKPTQVMIIGDSYINWITHTFHADLQAASGQKGWRFEALGGTSIGSGGAFTPIPKQFDESLARDPDVHTVVMDGGGNDVLVASPEIDPEAKCKNDAKSPTLPECQKIVQIALKAGEDLMNRAAKAGVRDVVYFFYPEVPEGTLIGGAHPNAINAYALPKTRAMCEEAVQRTDGKLRCHFVDLVPVFAGHDDWFFPADIHPNSKGSKAMADVVWKTMKDACVGQPASSGCCEP